MDLSKQLSRYIAVANTKHKSSSDWKNPEFALEAALEILANDDDDKFSENNPDRLKVLVDPDAQKLVMKLFQQYISEDDFSSLVMFIKDFDSFLGKYRDRPLTKQEIDKIEQSQEEGDGEDDEVVLPKKKGKGRRSKQAPVEDIDTESEPEMDDEIVEDAAPEMPDTEDEDYEDEPSVTVSKAAKLNTVARINKYLQDVNGKK